jgi:hypothetical protein
MGYSHTRSGCSVEDLRIVGETWFGDTSANSLGLTGMSGREFRSGKTEMGKTDDLVR